MLLRRWMWIVWPAFLAAGVMEMSVFAFVDPMDLPRFADCAQTSRLGVCTAAFFVFWGVTIMASAMTCLLALSPKEVNGAPSASA